MTQAQVNDTQTRIVEAAVQLFSRQGFNGTGTRDIARLADVNETSLFRHFPRKHDLFWAALQSQLERLRFGKVLDRKLAQDVDPETGLPLIVQFAVETAAYQPEVIRLLRFSVMELRPGAERIYRTQLGPIFCSIVGYFERCSARGALRDVDASIVTVSLFATALSHEALQKLFTGESAPYANTEQVVSAYSRFWLELLLPIGATGSVKPAVRTEQVIEGPSL
jgi:AcrR family transcriptional regulator